MKYLDTDIIAEVRKAREELLRKHGGIDGLHKYMDKERPLLEAQGWKFTTIEDVFMKKHSQVLVSELV
ncbi:MAG: hypothetical protein LBU17_10545 [Treponema sp.]|jgi:hypothetical protein|nr:hypothetical protein [Treponema sp.]